MGAVLYGKDIFDIAYRYVKPIFLKKYEAVLIEAGATVASSGMSEQEKEIALRDELEMRTPFILASVCSELAELDTAYRESVGAEEREEFSTFFLGIGKRFPLSERFSFACAMYLCSMFLIDFDSERSDVFFEKYASAVSAISKEVSCTVEHIKEKYPY